MGVLGILPLCYMRPCAHYVYSSETFLERTDRSATHSPPGAPRAGTVQGLRHVGSGAHAAMDWTFCELQYPEPWAGHRVLSAGCEWAFRAFQGWKSDFPAWGAAGGKGPLCARLRGPHPQASCAGVDNICGFTVCFHFNVKQSWSSNMCMNKQNSSVEIAAEAGREEERALHLGPGGAVSAFEK